MADLFNKLESLFDQKKYKEALAEVRTPEHDTYIKESPNFLTLLLKMPLQENFSVDAEICLEEILLYLVKTVHWEYTLFEILEQVDFTQPHNLFRIAVKCLEEACIECLVDYISPEPVERVCTRIQKYLSKQGGPKNWDVDIDKVIIDSEDIVDQLSRLMDVVARFYDGTSKVLSSVDWREVPNPKLWHTHHAFGLFRAPLLYLQVHDGSYAHAPCSHLIRTVLSVYPNFERILNLISSKQSNRIVFHPESVGLFLYCLYYLELGHNYAPQIYCMKYVYRRSLSSVLALLDNDYYLVQEKGLNLFHSFLKRLPKDALDSSYLELSDLMSLFKKLVHLMVYSDQEALRSSALNIYRTHISKWDLAARLQFFHHLMSFSEHSGFKALVLQSFKNELAQLKTPLKPQQEAFCGVILKKAWTLPQRETSDLLDHNDIIMATLNALIFLCSCRDFRLQLVVPYLEDIEKNFLEHVRVGMNLSRIHYEKQANETSTSHHSVTVSGEIVPEMTPQQKSEVLKLAVNHFDMMALSHAQLVTVIESLKAFLKEKKTIV